mgnify:CR=1 FL=1
MGKILILFDTITGNTEKMAQYVAEGAARVQGIDIRVRSVQEASASDLEWCDGIALGTPTNMGTVSWRMKQFWDVEAKKVWSQIDGKIGCAFSSSGGWGGGAELACMTALTILMNFGFLVFGVTDYVSPDLTLHYGAVVAKAPRTENEIAACRKLGARLAQWVILRMGVGVQDKEHR